MRIVRMASSDTIVGSGGAPHSNMNAHVETTTISINVMNQPNLKPGWRKALSCNASWRTYSTNTPLIDNASFFVVIDGFLEGVAASWSFSSRLARSELVILFARGSCSLGIQWHRKHRKRCGCNIRMFFICFKLNYSKLAKYSASSGF